MAQRIAVEDWPLNNVHLLRAVLRKLHIDHAERPPECVISLHAKLIADLAEELVLLESQNRHAASPAIARAIYESLFKLGLALKKPELSAEYTLREVEWSRIQEEKIEGASPNNLVKIRKCPEYAPVDRSVSRIAQHWKLTPEQIDSCHIPRTKDYALGAEMVPLYQNGYAELSSFAHGSGPHIPDPQSRSCNDGYRSCARDIRHHYSAYKNRGEIPKQAPRRDSSFDSAVPANIQALLQASILPKETDIAGEEVPKELI